VSSWSIVRCTVCLGYSTFVEGKKSERSDHERAAVLSGLVKRLVPHLVVPLARTTDPVDCIKESFHTQRACVRYTIDENTRSAANSVHHTAPESCARSLDRSTGSRTAWRRYGRASLAHGSHRSRHLRKRYGWLHQSHYNKGWDPARGDDCCRACR